MMSLKVALASAVAMLLLCSLDKCNAVTFLPVYPPPFIVDSLKFTSTWEKKVQLEQSPCDIAVRSDTVPVTMAHTGDTIKVDWITTSTAAEHEQNDEIRVRLTLLLEKPLQRRAAVAVPLELPGSKKIKAVAIDGATPLPLAPSPPPLLPIHYRDGVNIDRRHSHDVARDIVYGPISKQFQSLLEIPAELSPGNYLLQIVALSTNRASSNMAYSCARILVTDPADAPRSHHQTPRAATSPPSPAKRPGLESEVKGKTLKMQLGRKPQRDNKLPKTHQTKPDKIVIGPLPAPLAPPSNLLRQEKSHHMPDRQVTAEPVVEAGQYHFVDPLEGDSSVQVGTSVRMSQYQQFQESTIAHTTDLVDSHPNERYPIPENDYLIGRHEHTDIAIPDIHQIQGDASVRIKESEEINAQGNDGSREQAQQHDGVDLVAGGRHKDDSPSRHTHHHSFIAVEGSPLDHALENNSTVAPFDMRRSSYIAPVPRPAEGTTAVLAVPRAGEVLSVKDRSPCNKKTSPNRMFCISKSEDYFARCVHGSWIFQQCAPGTVCRNGQCDYPAYSDDYSFR